MIQNQFIPHCQKWKRVTRYVQLFCQLVRLLRFVLFNRLVKVSAFIVIESSRTSWCTINFEKNLCKWPDLLVPIGLIDHTIIAIRESVISIQIHSQYRIKITSHKWTNRKSVPRGMTWMLLCTVSAQVSFLPWLVTLVWSACPAPPVAPSTPRQPSTVNTSTLTPSPAPTPAVHRIRYTTALNRSTTTARRTG